MKLTSALFSLLVLLAVANISIGQVSPQTSIPFFEVQNVLGVEPGQDFALVYKGDTLASYSSSEKHSLTTLFDEEIRCVNYGDSVEYEYSLPNKSGIHRISLPDSLPVFTKDYVFETTESRLIRYDSRGDEKYKVSERKGNKIITQHVGKGTEVIAKQEGKWSFSYSQREPDSNFYQNFTIDTTLTSKGYRVARKNGDRVIFSLNTNPYYYSTHFNR